MNFNDLKQGIQTLSDSFRQNAVAAVNTHLTVRNWLIGFYIVEFEQNGEDRAKYGAKLLQNLADGFDEDGLSYRNLRLYRQFYFTYPQVSAYIPKFTQKYFGEIWQSPIAKLQTHGFEEDKIGQSVIAKFDTSTEPQQILPIEKLVSKLSFTHLTLLFPIEAPLKRLFYEIECIKGTWSVRELKRQIDSLYFERSGMSQNPAALSRIVQDNSEAGSMLDTIKHPFTFEFLGLKAKHVVYETDLEQALIEHLEEFLMELGHGFCFEARQKRIIVGDEYYFCDLVFYNRILKCHVLIELKVGSFSHEHIGQLKTYVNYYRKEIMRPDDNPPVGILLVTNKNQALVEYATADSDNELFVSKYLLELPTKEQLIKFINEEYSKV
ncbi:MAG: PDDEXK nuclease domain-containing protein [Tannerella sp.]|jgi:predicted nuclease of restriction endonuclease-like (RecB) superfamily|nr:PDDEXK nuclease domain-containing protein [Tannerella sp.]